MEFTDKSHRAKQQMEWAEQDINRKLILLATFEGKLAQIAKLEEEFGKMKEEMGKIEKELDGGTKELYEKCQDELEEYEDARSEFESDSD
jgi:hypothetical protein